MAVFWNFNAGVDWANDPTGNTILPFHCFVDGLLGSDSNDGLTPQTALKSITQAKALYSNLFTIVVAPYVYNDQYGNTSLGDNYSLMGDTDIDNVLLVDTNNTRTGIGNNNTTNVVLSNYLNSIGGFQRTVVDCTFVNCSNTNAQFLFGCRFINSPLSKTFNANTDIFSSAFFNSNVTINNSGGTQGIDFSGCFMDNNSLLSHTVGASNLIDCHVENQSSWSVINIDTATTFGNSFINGQVLLNYSIDPVQSPLFRPGFPDGFSNPRLLSKFYTGYDFFTGETDFDNAIAANPFLSVVANNIVVDPASPTDTQSIETPEITLDSLQVLGIPHPVGVTDYGSTLLGLNPSPSNYDRVVEIRYSTSLTGSFTAYKRFRIGSLPTENVDGTSNGEESYSWGDNNLLIVRRYQVRYTFIKAGVV